MTLTDEDLSTTLDAYLEFGSQRAAAEALGISQSTLAHRLQQATLRGISVSHLGPRLDPGMILKGRSTYYTADGEAKGQWVKENVQLQETIDGIRDAFESYKGMAILPDRGSMALDSDLFTVYPLADLHLGMYAWAAETGNDYDLVIAEKLVIDALKNLIALAPATETALLLNLGDFFHADNFLNRTSKSNNALDVDSRHSKVTRTGVRIVIQLVQLLLQKYKNVIFRSIPGNHDEQTAGTLAIAAEAYFAGSERVYVDPDPGPFFFHRFGKVLIGATHGHKAKLEDMPGIMAAKRAADWGVTEHRYIYGGHWHTHKKWPDKEKAGAEVEIFRTLAPKDAWNNSMGFVAGRGMVCIVHHRETGEKFRITDTVKGPE